MSGWETEAQQCLGKPSSPGEASGAVPTAAGVSVLCSGTAAVWQPQGWDWDPRAGHGRDAVTRRGVTSRTVQSRASPALGQRDAGEHPVSPSGPSPAGDSRLPTPTTRSPWNSCWLPPSVPNSDFLPLVRMVRFGAASGRVLGMAPSLAHGEGWAACRAAAVCWVLRACRRCHLCWVPQGHSWSGACPAKDSKGPKLPASVPCSGHEHGSHCPACSLGSHFRGFSMMGRAESYFGLTVPFKR